MKQTPVDALPDLSDVQVIIKTSFPGQAPQVVEDQVTYPLTTAMLSVPKATTVRGYSFFGDSYVYVIFEDGTDLYWARSRVLEYLSQVPAVCRKRKPALGPDATGVGWVFEYALVDRTGQHDLAELRSLQDWFLKYELQTVPGVAEVATIGGMVRQYQVVVDPDKLRAFGMPLAKLKQAISAATRRPAARSSRWARPSTWFAPPATCRASRISRDSARRQCAGHAAAAGRRRRDSHRPADAPRHRRPRRRGRGRRRRRRHALGRERARRPSTPSRHASTNSSAACPKASRSSRPTTART